MPDLDRPGWQSSEFLLALAVIVGATVLAASHTIDGVAWSVAVTGATGFYSASRAAVKREAVTSTTMQARTEAYLEHVAADELRRSLEAQVVDEPADDPSPPTSTSTGRRPRADRRPTSR